MPTPTEATGIDAHLPPSSDGLSTPAPVILPPLPVSSVPESPPISFAPGTYEPGVNTLAPPSSPDVPVSPGPMPAPMQPASTSSLPTWVYVVGGIAAIGLVGLVVWLATRPSSGALPAATEGRRNPLPRSRRRSRRGRRIAR